MKQKKLDAFGTSKLIFENDCAYLCDNICDMLESGAYGEMPKIVDQIKGLDMENLRGINLIDDVWKILKSKNSLSVSFKVYFDYFCFRVCHCRRCSYLYACVV